MTVQPMMVLTSRSFPPQRLSTSPLKTAKQKKKLRQSKSPSPAVSTLPSFLLRRSMMLRASACAAR